MLNLKVGMMPGKLVEVAVEEGTTVGEIFSIAGVTVDNHDIRLDGNKVSLDSTVTSGALLVATKQIKGNAGIIKVGMMPGKLTEISYTGEQTVGELFSLAGVSVDNHDIRLDGEKVILDTLVTSGSLLVATKQIKGNCDCEGCDGTCSQERKYIAINLTPHEIELLLGISLPTELSEDMIEEIDNDLIQVKLGANDKYIIEEDMFGSVYELVTEEEVMDVEDVQEECTPVFDEPVATQVAPSYPEGYEENIDMLLNEVIENQNRYKIWMEQCTAQIEVLQELKFRVKK